MKLQKLCYYCQAWHLALHDKPLFEENFVRWAYGPVCRELYNLHKGMFYIKEGDIPVGSALSDEAAEHVTLILNAYGKYSGAMLSEITHGEDPWKKTKRNQIITGEKICEYYRNL
jgi:uncharacterized phage-associated protein